MHKTKQHAATPVQRVPVRLAAGALALAGLSASVLASTTAGAATSHAAKSVVISTVKNAKLGTLLVSGKTLYTLKPSKTPCTTACLKIWAELTLPTGVAKATAGSGVTAAKLGIVARAGGVRQVTYGGEALYWFSEDKAAGQVKGNVTDTWGKWSDVVTAKPVTTGPTTTSPTNTGTGATGF